MKEAFLGNGQVLEISPFLIFSELALCSGFGVAPNTVLSGGWGIKPNKIYYYKNYIKSL